MSERKQPTLFDGARMTQKEALRLTAESLAAYGGGYPHWAVAFSGGKDSTATVTVVCHLLATGQVEPPESLTVMYADTRMELPPLHATAMRLLQALTAKGVRTHVVLPDMDHRFFVYMFGRGVPPPKNRFRWCTPQLKVTPMLNALRELREAAAGKLLMLTGVRLGESAARDARISLSCSRDGAECGQGWFQEATPESIADTLAPLLHWRVCHVWDWLSFDAPALGYPTRDVATVYGGDEAVESNARTGCVGCNLTSRDHSLLMLLRKFPDYSYLQPLFRLRPLYAELTLPHSRLRKHDERKADGSRVKNVGRMGPLTMEARQRGLAEVLDIQHEIEAQRPVDMPGINLVNDEEHARILELIEANTWPDRWDGTEARADEPFEQIGPGGEIQQLLPTGGGAA